MEHFATIVTAYYKFPSKHSHDKYNEWMRNMLENLVSPIVIFTDVETKDQIEDYRKRYMHITDIIIKPFNELLMYKYLSVWNQQLELDPEKHIHNTNLYIIWNEKLNFVKLAKDRNVFNSQWFLWMDIGCFRNRREVNDIELHRLSNWPSNERLETLPKNKLSLVRTSNAFTPNNYNYDDNKITNTDLKHMISGHVGGLFVIHRDAIDEIHTLYYEMIDKYIQHNRFAGKDQNVLANLCVAYPDHFNLIDPNYGCAWFYLHHYLAR